jgi:hypothetical protein
VLDEEFGRTGLEVVTPGTRPYSDDPDFTVSSKEQTSTVAAPARTPARRDEILPLGFLRPLERPNEDLLLTWFALLIGYPLRIWRDLLGSN